MPGEEFLPRPPHPDDIIYVDENEAKVGDKTNHSGFGGESSEESGNPSDGKQKNEGDKSENCDKLTDQSDEMKATDQSDAMKQADQSDAMEQTDQSDAMKQTDQSGATEQTVSVESSEGHKNES